MACITEGHVFFEDSEECDRCGTPLADVSEVMDNWLKSKRCKLLIKMHLKRCIKL